VQKQVRTIIRPHNIVGPHFVQAIYGNWTFHTMNYSYHYFYYPCDVNSSQIPSKRELLLFQGMEIILW